MSRRQDVIRQLRLVWHSQRSLSAVGVLAAAVLFVSVNVLASRFFWRVDLTSAQLYSLSSVTTSALEELDEPVEVVVFLAQGDPLTSSVRYMLDAYRANNPLLKARFVDPDRSPAEFVALQKEYGIFEGRTENGRLATEASIVVTRAGRRWFITTDDLVHHDNEAGEARPRLEQALTEALVNVRDRQPVSVCLTAGHQELSAESGGSQGLKEFRLRLEQNNYRVRSVDLSSPDPSQTLQGCALIVVAGPQLRFSEAAAERLDRHLTAHGGGLILALGPVLGESTEIVDSGLGSVLQRMDISPGHNLVFEAEPTLRLPVGFAGEVFLATPKADEITHGLRVAGREPMRVLFQLTQEVKTPGRCLLATSEKAFSVDTFEALAAQDADALVKVQREGAREHCLAAAWTSPGPDGRRPYRTLVLGSPSVLWSSTWLESSLLGTRTFIENAVSWLVEQPQLVSVPEKPAAPAGLALSDAALSEVQRYVLIYMPLCAALIGGLILWRRRQELAEVGGGES